MREPIITFGVLMRWILSLLLIIIIPESPKWVISWTFATSFIFLELYWYLWQREVRKGLKESRVTPLKWFKTKNPFLGGVSPIDMIKAGREVKLCKYILNTIEENDNG